MNLSLFVFLLFSLQIFYWLIGKRACKDLNSREDYFLAGKSVRLFPLTMTFLATQVGGGVILGAADEAYIYGWPVLCYPLGASMGLILLGLGVGRKLASFHVSTVAQIFEKVYRSSVLKTAASILSVLSLFMILVAQIIASNKFLVSIGLENNYLFILFWAIVILYTTQGGLKSVISTDMVQAAFFSLTFLLAFFLILNSQDLNGAFAWPAAAQFDFIAPKLSGWLLMPLLFMVIEQDMAQRCFAGASPKTVSQASTLAGIGTLLICIVPVFIGVLARTLNMEVPSGGSVLMTAITRTTGPLTSALIGCAVLAAIISTATSLINAISSNLSQDFRVLQKTSSLRLARILTASISIAAICFAFYFDNIVDLLIQSYELSVSCLFVPIVMAFFLKRGSLFAAYASCVFGALGFFFFRFYPVYFPRELASVFSSLAAFIFFGIVEKVFFTRLLSKAS